MSSVNDSHSQGPAVSRDDDEEWTDEDEEDEGEEEDDDYSELELRPLQFSNECPSLPTNQAIGCPHVVNTSGFDEETDMHNLRFANGIATFLWKWDREQFNKFFDMSEERFEVHYEAQSLIKDMLLTRMGNMVMVSRFSTSCARTQQLSIRRPVLESKTDTERWSGIRESYTSLKIVANGRLKDARCLTNRALWSLAGGCSLRRFYSTSSGRRMRIGRSRSTTDIRS